MFVRRQETMFVETTRMFNGGQREGADRNAARDERGAPNARDAVYNSAARGHTQANYRPRDVVYNMPRLPDAVYNYGPRDVVYSMPRLPDAVYNTGPRDAVRNTPRLPNTVHNTGHREAVHNTRALTTSSPRMSQVVRPTQRRSPDDELQLVS